MQSNIPGVDSSVISRGQYKGHNLLVFYKEDRFPFSFGASKARSLLSAINQIGAEKFIEILRNFVRDNPQQSSSGRSQE